MTTKYRKYDSEYIRMSISLPNEVREMAIDAAEILGIPLYQFMAAAIREHARDTIGLPKPPPAHAPIPTVAEVLRSYVDGESRLIGPCGERWPCKYDEQAPEIVGDWEFCRSCGIRTR